MLMRLHVVRPARHLRGQALPVTARGAQPGAGLLRPVQPPGQAGLEQAGHPHWPVEGDQPGDRGRHGVDSQQTGQSSVVFLCGPSLQSLSVVPLYSQTQWSLSMVVTISDIFL